ncbi:MAG: hypothetical protein O3C63_03570 [Cyanobacteria bacterium]|nr:hypothetical protein [Cyanobacteriota bacterium]
MLNQIAAAGANLIHRVDDKFHVTLPTGLAAIREPIDSKPTTKIANFHRAIVQTHFPQPPNPDRIARIKDYYFKEHVIKPENIPEAEFIRQQRIARDLGHGDVDITDELKKQLTEVIIQDQKARIEDWLDYLLSDDSSSYPIWAKHWAFDGMLKLGQYDKTKQKFSNRSSDTTAPFTELDREALALVMDLVIKKVTQFDTLPNHLSKQEKNTNLEAIFPEIKDDNQLKDLIQNANFRTLYEYAIKKLASSEKNLSTTEGAWVKYPKGSDHIVLVEALKGKGTGWCTAAESTARTQLSSGDFYVYFSFDSENKPTIPRAAIRMQNNSIAEVRGIAEQQNLDSAITDVVEDKLKEFQDGKLYKKKSADMKALTDIENTVDLTKDELRFLYEIDSIIEGFGYQKDPRIAEIKAKRDMKQDYASIFDVLANKVATSIDELNDDTKIFGGDLDLRSSQVTSLPAALTHIGGYLDLENSQVTSLPDALTHIGGYLDLSNSQVTSLPDALTHISSDLNLRSSQVTSLPAALTHIGGDLNLYTSKVTSLPDALTHIGGDLNLRSSQVTSLPDALTHIGGKICFKRDQNVKVPKLFVEKIHYS